MRLRNNPEAKNILARSPHVIKSFPFALPPNTVVELGMGKGDMITKLALLNPDKFYVGIEKYATVAERANRIAIKEAINNFKIICDDAADMTSFFSGKVSTIWMTFSDPWPKDRHEKRRLTSDLFLAKIKQILAQDGVIKLKTDNDRFFNYSISQFTNNGFKLAFVTQDLHSQPWAENNVMTAYEKKWSDMGKKINYLEARK